MPGMSNQVEEQLKGLPAKPGVYLFRDEKGQVLYIGKAKSLRSRVRSYFQATPDSRSTIQRLPERVADVGSDGSCGSQRNAGHSGELVDG